MLLICKADLLKKIAIAVLMVLFLMMMPQSTAAVEGLKLSASSEKGVRGNQVIVTIKAENAAGTEGGQFLLTFDQNLVRPVSVEAGNLIARSNNLLQLGNLDYAPGQLMYMWITVYGDTADKGNVCEIKFDLLKEGETLLRFDEIVVAPDSIGTAVSAPGKVIISSGAPATEPAVSKPAEPDRDRDQDDLVDSVDDSGVNSDENDESTDKIIEDNAIGISSSLYSIGVVILAVLLITGFFVIKHLKKQARKRIKRKDAGRTKV